MYSEVCDSLYDIYGDQFDIDQYLKDDTMNIEFTVNVPMKDHKYENINMAIKTYYEQLDLVKKAGLKLGLEFEVEPEVRKALCFKSA
ncbi:hypothetical protein IP81_07605 [Novosphingobium sp. AAP83]|nr:hypothetical protein IP81_07605 [Novosphingobium sp. AAP83]